MQIPFCKSLLHTLTVDSNAAKPAETNGWQRLGALVREARLRVGYPNREDFAAACNVSVRVLSDLESGARSNFSERVLSRLESGLDWPPGTVDQIVFDSSFVPPKSTPGSDLMFRPPAFDRTPVQVEVGTVEKTIALLAELSRESGVEASKEGSAVNRIGAVAVALCWPYVIRLVEDNCLPGNALHPSVRPLYQEFLSVQDTFAPQDTSGRYARWLAGDMPDAPDAVRRRYHERWTESRRSRPGRRAIVATESDD